MARHTQSYTFLFSHTPRSTHQPSLIYDSHSTCSDPHLCKHTHTHTHSLTCMHARMCTHTHTHTHTHTLTLTHTHTHTNTLSWSWLEFLGFSMWHFLGLSKVFSRNSICVTTMVSVQSQYGGRGRGGGGE